MKFKLLEEYDSIKEEIDFLTKSEIRLNILICLYSSDLSIKELKEKTNLNYSSIISNLNKLEEKKYITKNKEEYTLKSSVKLKLINILYLNKSLELIKNLSNFITTHTIKNNNLHALGELPAINNYEIITSTNTNPYKVTDIFKITMTRLGLVNAICVYLHPKCKEIIREIMEQDSGMNLIVSEQVAGCITKNSQSYVQKNKIKNKYFNLKKTKTEIKISMVVSEKEIIIGLCKTDGTFDRNTCLRSEDNTAIEWGNQLFHELESKGGKYIPLKEIAYGETNIIKQNPPTQ